MPQQLRPAVPILREAEAAGNTSDVDVDVDHQLLIESVGGDSLPDVPLPDVPLPDLPLPKARTDGLVGENRTSPRVAEEAIVIEFRLRSGSYLVRFLCSNLLISGIYDYTHGKVFGSLKVYSIYGFCISFIFIDFIFFIVLWDIAHAAFLQLLACKQPPCDGVEAY